MAAIFLQKDAQELLKNKYIVVMGGSIQRSIYKDLIRLIQGNTFLTDNLLRMKGEDSCLKDQLLDGGMRGKDKKGIGYREVRQYQTDFYFLQFVFMTRSYNSYVESVINKLASAEQKPDVIIINSCLWDITRYGKTPDIPEYKRNLQRLFKKLKEALPECLVIWNTNPAISHNPKGGVFIPGLDYLKDSMELHVLESNYYASKVAIENGHDVVDLHYFLRHQIHRRAEDGIHWDMTGHRRITNLLLTHIAQTWGVKLPKHIKINGQESKESEQIKKRKSKSPNTKMFSGTNHVERKKAETNEEKVQTLVQNKEPEKPKHDDVVVVQVPQEKPQTVTNNGRPKPKKKKRKRGRGGGWQNQNDGHVFDYNHTPNIQYNFAQTNQNPFHPTASPLMQQNIGVNQYQQPVIRPNPYHESYPFNQVAIRETNYIQPNHDFHQENYQMLNFDNGQWQTYQEDDLSYGSVRHFANPEPHRFNPYTRGRGMGRGYMY